MYSNLISNKTNLNIFFVVYNKKNDRLDMIANKYTRNL